MTLCHETGLGGISFPVSVKQWTPMQALPYERPALSKGYLKPSGPAR
jgi:hypothetical protein